MITEYSTPFKPFIESILALANSETDLTKGDLSGFANISGEKMNELDSSMRPLYVHLGLAARLGVLNKKIQSDITVEMANGLLDKYSELLGGFADSTDLLTAIKEAWGWPGQEGSPTLTVIGLVKMLPQLQPCIAALMEFLQFQAGAAAFYVYEEQVGGATTTTAVITQEEGAKAKAAEMIKNGNGGTASEVEQPEVTSDSAAAVQGSAKVVVAGTASASVSKDAVVALPVPEAAALAEEAVVR